MSLATKSVLAVLGFIGFALTSEKPIPSLLTVSQLFTNGSAIFTVGDPIKIGIDKSATAPKEDIKNVVKDITAEKFTDMKFCFIKCIKCASSIWRGVTGFKRNQSLKKEHIKEIMETNQPFIYRGTPMIKALNHAYTIFSDNQYKL